MTQRKKVLVVGLGTEAEEMLRDALARTDLEVSRVRVGPSAAELVALIPFDIVLIGFPMQDVALSDLLVVLRRQESPSSRAAVLLISAPELLPQAEAYLPSGVDRVLSTGTEATTLQEEVLRLLRAKPRLAMRVMARLTVRLDEAAAQFLCQTRDLSRTGVLVLTDRLYPVGTLVKFTLELVGAPLGVRGEAEVVRHADPRREKVEGLGLRFVSFEGGSQAHLATFLEKLGA